MISFKNDTISRRLFSGASALVFSVITAHFLVPLFAILAGIIGAVALYMCLSFNKKSSILTWVYDAIAICIGAQAGWVSLLI